MHRLPVEESSQVGEARRIAASLARDLGFDEERVEQVSIVVTELAANVAKHAGKGELLLRALQDTENWGIETLALDRGPGIANVAQCLRDGFSTVGGQGTGLGSIMRLSSLFDIYSTPGEGTAVLSRIRRQLPVAAPAGSPDLGVLCLPVATETVCGDAWALHQESERTLIMLADGLGHGQFAAEASGAAAAIFAEHADEGPAALIERMHLAMRGTRGAAVAIAELLWKERVLRYAGVGNISAQIISFETLRGLLSHNGTLGLEARRIQELAYPWPEDGLLVMNTDGLASHWNLEDYPLLRGRHPALIAGVLFRDHSRVRDDCTVLVIRETGAP